MGIIYDSNAPIKDICSMYGVTLRGRYNEYHSCFNDDINSCIVDIFVNNQHVVLNEHCIFASSPSGQYINMDADKELLCYYLSKHSMTDYELEQFFIKEYHSCFWRTEARNTKMRENLYKQRLAENERLKELREHEISKHKEYVDKKGLFLIITSDTVYYLKLDKLGADLYRQGRLVDDIILEFAEKHPGHGVEIVKSEVIKSV